jgi:ketosteroid isomerase-like protein
MTTPRLGSTPRALPTVKAADSAPAAAAPTTTASTPAPAGWGARAPVRVQAVQSQASATPTQVAEQFYTAFGQADGAGMQALYAPDATFHDPLFDLKGQSAVGGMWTGILKKGSDLHLSSKVLSAEGNTVKVAWTADYKLLGRPIHNESITTMTMRDGKIASQRDDWSWSKWAKQAFPLGPLVDVPPIKWALRKVIQNS